MNTHHRASAATMIRVGSPAGPRHDLSERQWADLVDRLRTDPLMIAGLWSDGERVHALALESADAPLIASVAVEAKRYLALSSVRPELAIQERAIRDLWGIEAMDAHDLRPWLDHGTWSQTAPLAARPGPAAWPPEPPEFEWSETDERAGAMQVPIGPVQNLVHGPAQFRITVIGDRIRRIESLFGYAHRGVAFAMRAKSVAEAAALVGRIDATSIVAHQTAFAEAIEAALEWRIDAPVAAMRRGMGALERIGNRLRTAGLHSHRARLAAACGAAFGHRYMRDCIAPGGWRRSPDDLAFGEIQVVLADLESSARRDDRRGNDPPWASDLAVARRALGEPIGAGIGDRTVRRHGIVEAIGSAVTLHGPLFHWLRLENGAIAGWYAIDPVLIRLAKIEQNAAGMTIEDFEQAIRSAGLSAAGADL